MKKLADGAYYQEAQTKNMINKEADFILEFYQKLFFDNKKILEFYKKIKNFSKEEEVVLHLRKIDELNDYYKPGAMYDAYEALCFDVYGFCNDFENLEAGDKLPQPHNYFYHNYFCEKNTEASYE